MERNNIIEKKAVRRPRRVLDYWRGLILNLKTNMNFGTARNYRNHPKYADLLIAKKLASVYSRVFL